jgi:phosphatidylinositol alpha-1,6-mannosyltransferase
LLGRCDDRTLSDAFQAADVHIFPVRDTPGDVEGFGMVAIEAAAHGLPTVAFDVGGVADAVVAGRTGSLVSSSDYEEFASQVLQWLDRSRDERCRTSCRTASYRFSWERFDSELRSLIEENLQNGSRTILRKAS